MANVKISELNAASTPLAGTEVLPIVQSTATVKVSVANLTAGRAVSAATLTTTGNVGVGTSPSAWNSAYKALQFSSTGSLYGEVGEAAVYLGCNVYVDSVGNKYTTTDFASQYNQENGVHKWLNAASGTAGNAITFTQAMTLDASGRLIVGGSNVNGRIQSLTPASYTESSFRADSATAASVNWNHFYGTSSSNSVANIIIYGNGNIVNANNSYGSLSDSKLKENIVDASPKLADLMQVQVRNYNFKSDPSHKQIGVVAQELEQVFPSMIDESPDRDSEGNDLGTTTKSVKYSVFVPMLIKAMQEQQALIATLTQRITALEAK
jgi:hypothetical protein